MQNDSGPRQQTSLQLLIRAARTHKRVVERQISELGIHGGQHQLLMTLARLGEFPAQTELARRMDVSPATAANMLKRLESGGYIERRARSSDGRCNEVRITDKGHQVVDQSVCIFEGVDRRMFEGISEAERSQLRATLGKLLDNLSRMEEEIGCGAEESPTDEERNETRP